MGTAEIIEVLIREIEKAEARGISRYQLAQRTGVPQSTLSRLVNRGRESLRVETAEKLAREFHGEFSFANDYRSDWGLAFRSGFASDIKTQET